MKKFSKLFLLCGAVASTAALVNARDWEIHPSQLVDNYEGMSVAADFTNNGRLDIYHTGTYATEWCKPHNFRVNGPETISSLLINNPDGTFSLDWNYPVNYEDPTFNADDYVEGQENNTYMRMPNHNIAPAGRGDFLALDYNNDGLVDLITFNRQDHSGWWYFWGADLRDDEGNRLEEGQYTPRRNERLSLYKNLGNGKFELVTNTGILELSSPDGEACRALSAGDYDHDGYIDLLVSGNYHESAYEEFVNEKFYHNRYVKLYRNRGAVSADEPQFEEMFIAETEGGVWTREVKDEEDQPVNQKEQLEGHFAAISGNAQFADLNNDGWLDVIISGYGDSWMGDNYSAGALVRIYLNEEGKKFVDVTNQNTLLEGANNGSVVINDFNKDGSLDFITSGYSWHIEGGWHTLLYLNQNDENIYTDFIYGDNELGIPGTEGGRIFASDFDNDGNVDIYFATALDRGAIFYGKGGSFEEDNTDMDEFWKCDRAHTGVVGDFDNDGFADIYVPRERQQENDMAVNPNPKPATIRLNRINSGAAEAPEAPVNATYALKDGKLSINWEYDTEAAIDANLAYNVLVKFADGSIYTLVPADAETGFVKVAEGKQVALRPNVKSYELACDKEFSSIGVQALSLSNHTASKFAPAIEEGSGVAAIAADEDATPVYFNLFGVRVENPEKGQMVIEVKGSKATKKMF
ncbi:MAG: VCBS repeat-containing protein [Bacteroides sp.]|nr:VCBS repeat-containing protein [Bacteroides sp.]